jgi:hypothetical protein
VGLQGDEIADLHIGHAVTDGNNFASGFVPDDAGDFFQVRRHPRLPLVKVDIATADGTEANPH